MKKDLTIIQYLISNMFELFISHIDNNVFNYSAEELIKPLQKNNIQTINDIKDNYTKDIITDFYNFNIKSYNLSNKKLPKNLTIDYVIQSLKECY